MSLYNFEENILTLSETDNPDILPKEWIHISYNPHLETPVTCICNRDINNNHIFLNIKTKRMINVGSTCVKKLRLNKKKTVRFIIHNFINGSRGDYQEICDLIKYSNDNWISFLESINSKVNSDWNNIIGLIEINNIIKLFTDNNIDCTDLHNIVTQIQKRIDEKKLRNEALRLRAEKLRIEQQDVFNKIKRDEEKRKRDEEQKNKLRKLRELAEQEKQKRDEEQKKKLRELEEEERRRIFQKIKKSDWGVEERNRIKCQIETCDACNILQRCRTCSDKITKELNNRIYPLVDLEYNSKYT
jgi:hypothetical protein